MLPFFCLTKSICAPADAEDRADPTDFSLVELVTLNALGGCQIPAESAESAQPSVILVQSFIFVIICTFVAAQAKIASISPPLWRRRAASESSLHHRQPALTWKKQPRHSAWKRRRGGCALPTVFPIRMSFWKHLHACCVRSLYERDSHLEVRDVRRRARHEALAHL